MRVLAKIAGARLVWTLLLPDVMSAGTDERWEILPALTFFQGVLFPGMRCCVLLETVEAFGAVREATRSWGEKSLAVFAARGWPGPQSIPELFDVGAVAEVLNLERPACGKHWMAELRAVGRLRSCEQLRQSPYRIARIERLREPAEDPALLRGLVMAVRESSRRLASLHVQGGDEARAIELLRETTDPSEVLGHAMTAFRGLSLEDQQSALELPLISERLAFVLGHMHRQIVSRHPRRLRVLH